MTAKENIKTDCLGRPIPNWSDITLFLDTGIEDINLDIDKFLRNTKFCTVLTDLSQSSNGKVLISCKLKDGSKILNLNDLHDYKLARSCMGEFEVNDIDDHMMKYLSYCGFAGIFYPTIVGVKICDPAKHLISKGITRKH